MVWIFQIIYHHLINVIININIKRVKNIQGRILLWSILILLMVRGRGCGRGRRKSMLGRWMMILLINQYYNQYYKKLHYRPKTTLNFYHHTTPSLNANRNLNHTTSTNHNINTNHTTNTNKQPLNPNHKLKPPHPHPHPPPFP